MTSPSSVRDLLASHGLGEYAGALEDAGLESASDLALISDDDLQAVGVTKLFHRRRLMDIGKKAAGAEEAPRVPAPPSSPPSTSSPRPAPNGSATTDDTRFSANTIAGAASLGDSTKTKPHEKPDTTDSLSVRMDGQSFLPDEDDQCIAVSYNTFRELGELLKIAPNEVRSLCETFCENDSLGRCHLVRNAIGPQQGKVIEVLPTGGVFAFRTVTEAMNNSFFGHLRALKVGQSLAGARDEEKKGGLEFALNTKMSDIEHYYEEQANTIATAAGTSTASPEGSTTEANSVATKAMSAEGDGTPLWSGLRLGSGIHWCQASLRELPDFDADGNPRPGPKRLHGAEGNVARELHDVAHPGQTLLTAQAYTQLRKEQADGTTPTYPTTTRALPPSANFTSQSTAKDFKDIVQCLPTVISSRKFPVNVAKNFSLDAVGLLRQKLAKMEQSDIQLGAELGSGSFGSVYIADCKLTNGRMAAKVLKTWEGGASATLLRKLVAEVEALHRLAHPNVVRYIRAAVDGPSPTIYMELCENGAFSSHPDAIQELTPATSAKWVVQVGALQMILEGMAYVHQQGVVHRDLKPQNVLIAADGGLKVSDFGVAHVSLDRSGVSHAARGVAGTWKYMAPEVIGGRPHGTPCDVYSVGVIALSLAKWLPKEFLNSARLRGEGLASYYATTDLVAATSAAETAVLAQAKGDVDRVATFADFVRKCVDTSPEARPSCSQLLQHKLFTSAPGAVGAAKEAFRGSVFSSSPNTDTAESLYSITVGMAGRPDWTVDDESTQFSTSA